MSLRDIVRRYLSDKEFEEHSKKAAAAVVARYLRAMEFPTDEALQAYLKKHPKANPSKHSVKKSGPQPNETKPDEPAAKDSGGKDGEDSKGAEDKDGKAFLTGLQKQFPEITFHVSVGKDSMSLGKVVVPKESRGSGLGSKFMKALIQEADKRKLPLTLTPSTDFGGSSVDRLKSFYKQFGFVENKGKHKDFSISDSMYRPTGAK